MWSGPAAWASLTASTTIRVTSTCSLSRGRPASSRASSSRSSTRTAIRVASDSTRPSACRDRRRHRLALAAGQLGVPADRRERGAQLVAGVGDELAHPHLALVPRRQRGADVVQQLVEGRPHLPHLGAGVGVGRGHPLGQGDGAAVQREVRHPGGGGRDAPQRAQGAAGQPGGAGGDQEQAEAGDDGDDERESLDRVVLRARSAARSRRCRPGRCARGWRRAASCPARRPGPRSSAAARRRRAGRC